MAPMTKTLATALAEAMMTEVMAFGMVVSEMIVMMK